MLTAIAVGALVLGLLALLAGLLALRTLGRLRHSVGLLGRGGPGRRESFLEVTARHAELTERTRAEFAALSETVTQFLASLQPRLDRDLATAYESLRADLQSLRGDVDVRAGDTRAGVDAQLTSIKHVVERELVQIRDRFEADRTAAFEAVESHRARLAANDAAARAELRAMTAQVEATAAGSLRRVALVRFDAFDDHGGRLSFALALLDGRGDGIVLSSLAGHHESRLYAKPVDAGRGIGELSPEEHEAVTAALKDR